MVMWPSGCNVPLYINGNFFYIYVFIMFIFILLEGFIYF